MRYGLIFIEKCHKIKDKIIMFSLLQEMSSIVIIPALDELRTISFQPSAASIVSRLFGESCLLQYMHF